MIVGKTFYPRSRAEWRSWLSKHHASAREIWVIYYRKDSGKDRVSYNHAVEEALCYGWIDSTTKSRDAESWVQRFSPRRSNSELSETNKERIRRLIKSKKMRRAGLTSISRHLSTLSLQPKSFIFPDDIIGSIKQNPTAWKNYRRFTLTYRRIRIGWIDGSRNRPEYFKKRLRYFIAMTEKNKRFGMVQ